MRILLVLVLIASIFFFIAVQSNTFEVSQVVEVRGGVEYISTEYSVHWDRFFDYVKNIPSEIRKCVSRKCRFISK